MALLDRSCAACGADLPLQLGRKYCPACAKSVTAAERARSWRAANRLRVEAYNLSRRKKHTLPEWAYRSWLDEQQTRRTARQPGQRLPDKA